MPPKISSYYHIYYIYIVIVQWLVPVDVLYRLLNNYCDDECCNTIQKLHVIIQNRKITIHLYSHFGNNMISSQQQCQNYRNTHTHTRTILILYRKCTWKEQTNKLIITDSNEADNKFDIQTIFIFYYTIKFQPSFA